MWINFHGSAANHEFHKNLYTTKNFTLLHFNLRYSNRPITYLNNFVAELLEYFMKIMQPQHKIMYYSLCVIHYSSYITTLYSNKTSARQTPSVLITDTRTQSCGKFHVQFIGLVSR